MLGYYLRNIIVIATKAVMNYLETGLPHTKFLTTKTMFTPPRLIPLCTLGRKYLGLDPVPKGTIDCLTKRLCQPKRIPEMEDAVKYVRPATSGTGRFVGEKRMSNIQIEKMVERLCNRRPTMKTQASADESSADSNDINSNTVDGDELSCDSEDENRESAIGRMRAKHNRVQSGERSEVSKVIRRDSVKSGVKRSHETTSGLRIHVDNNLVQQPSAATAHGKSDHCKKDVGMQSEKLDAKNIDEYLSASNKRNSLPGQQRRAEVIRKSTFREYLQRPLTATQQTSRGSWINTLDPAKSPRNKHQKIDDNKRGRQMTPSSEELLIDRVATYNRGNRPQFR